jgi:ABC-type enterochelin transport system permease subunit
MNQLSPKANQFIRNTGFILNGIGIGFLFSGSEWLRATNQHSIVVIGLVVMTIGTFLRSARNKEETEKEYERKSARYARIAERVGHDRIKSVYKFSLIATVVFFAIAMGIMISGSMNFVWPLIVMIAVALVLATFTHAPDPTSRSRTTR